MKTRTTEPAASRGGLRTGVLRGIPVLLGYFPVALAFGVMARNLPLPYAVMMSAVVYAGASQFMALNLLAGGVLPGEIILATLLLNFRHFLMSAALAARLGRRDGLTPFIAFGITDETFAVGSVGAVTPRFLIGLEATAYVGWVTGTLLGRSLGYALPAALQTALGIGLYGLFIGILVPEVRKNRRAGAVALFAAGLHWALRRFELLPPGWAIIAAIVAGAAFGVAISAKEPAEGGEHAAGTEPALETLDAGPPADEPVGGKPRDSGEEVER